MSTVLKIENLTKEYRLGVINRQMLYQDLQSRWARFRGKEDPNAIIGEVPADQVKGGKFLALKDISFDVQEGEVVGVIGRNGAGKSTLLKILAQITAPTSGKISIKGRIASLLEVGTGFHPELTGRENVYLNGTILGMKKRDIDRKFDDIAAFSGVEKFLDTPVKRYSSGMKVRLAFAVAAHLEPEILIVDEVLAVGDAEFQKKCIGKMKEISRDSGRTVLFVSHSMAAVSNLCSRSILLKSGEMEMVGKTEEVVRHYLQRVVPAVRETALAERTDRTGSGVIRFTDYWVEDNDGNRITCVTSGMDVTLALAYEVRGNRYPKNVDVGFSINNHNDQTLFVLYSSYTGDDLEITHNRGVFRCHVPKFPLTAGRYTIGARVSADSEESDWPRDGIGYLDVESGDFFGTGRVGFRGATPFLVGGSWTVSDSK